MKKKLIKSLAIFAALTMMASVGVYASEGAKKIEGKTVTEYTDVNAPSTYVNHGYYTCVYQYREVCQDCGATLSTWTETVEEKTNY